MFIVWTIATTWIFFLFDPAWFERPIEHHGIRSLQVFFPMTSLEWIVVGSWIIPLLFVIFQALFVRRLQRVQGHMPLRRLFPDPFGRSGSFGWLLIALACILAITGWTLSITTVLLPSTIAAIGLSLGKLEQV
jgi:hypothetical protein